MKKKTNLNIKIKALLILLVVMLTSFSSLNFPNSTNSGLNKKSDDSNTGENISDIEIPSISAVSFNSWWNSSFQYRRILNITNPNPTQEFIDQGVNITINYNDLSGVQADLSDIRIIENGVLRNYYYIQDYPSNNLVTIWFATNISVGQYDTDTFLYYGNNSVSIAHSYFIDDIFGLHYFPLDEGQGTQTDDIVSGDDGTFENSPEWVTPGMKGNAHVGFDASTDRINSDPGQSITTGEVSVSFWFNLDSQGSNTAVRKSSAAYLIEFGDGSGNGYGSSPQFYVSVSGGNHYVWGDAVDYNKWYHIVGTYDSTEMKLFLNGEEIPVTVRTGSRTGNVIDSTGALVLGGYGGERFLGEMDDVRIMDYALSPEDVKWLYSLNTTIDVYMDEEQSQFAEIEVHAIDLNGKYIPGVNITLYNHSAPFPLIQSKIADEEGGVDFVNIPLGKYNFTVILYSNVSSDLFAVVNRTSEPISIDNLNKKINLTCTVSTHEFDVVDADGEPVESGWINVGNGTDSLTIQNCTIDDTGKAIFRWVNTTPSYYYNYTVYYQNNDYNPQLIKLAENIPIIEPHIPINVETNLTTVNFEVYTSGDVTPISGAKLILRKDIPGEPSIVNLTTDINGQATLRWINSSSFIPGQIVNYSLQVYFSGNKLFNSTSDSVYQWNFTVSYKKLYDLRVQLNLEDYQTNLISINPTDDINVDWGTQVLLRAIFNVTRIANGDSESLLGYKYADSMIYQVLKGSDEVLSGGMFNEAGKEGYHSGTIDTTQLTGAQTYTVQITAIKSGFTPPTHLTLSLTILEIDVQLNQSQNDDSTQTVYWQEDVTMSVNPYGISSEDFILENSVYKDTQNNVYNCTIFVPELSTDWNISQVVFNLYDVTHDMEEKDIYVTIEDPFGGKRTWNGLVDTDNYYYTSAVATNGSWTDLVVPLYNRESSTNNNEFTFTIYGNFSDTDTVDVVAESTFIRDKINVEYLLHNITDTLSFYSYGEGWSIQNMTLEISNCFDTTDWSIKNPADVIDNITTNEGLVYTDIKGDTFGNGRIEINDTIIYPRNNQFLFLIGNNTNIVFDAKIKVEYIQGFYKTNYLEMYNVSLTSSITNDTAITISPEGSSWSDNGVLLSIRRIMNATADLKLPSEVGMTITIDGTNYYDILDFFPGEGYIMLNNIPGFSKNIIIGTTFKTNVPIDFELSFIVSNFRTFSYEIKGTVTYEIKPTEPLVTDQVPYNADLEYYETNIDTTVVDASNYIVVFNYNDPYNRYSSGTKDLSLTVEERITLLNGNSKKLTNIVTDIYVKDSVNFTFTFWDRDLDQPIEDLDTKSWSWWIGDTLQDSGNLVYDAQNDYFVLDFDTETRAVRTYSITIEFSKDNYQSKIVSIILTISLRTIDYDLGDEFDDKITSVVKGKIITLSIELTDPTQGDIPLTGAKVVLEIGNDELEFDEEDDGVYELEFDTKDYEAFFTSNTLTGTIKITREDYEEEEVDITIVIEMEEVMEGVPTFYFLMVIAAITAIVGSLATYRYIQVARIPTFIKKARKVKKSIKSGDKISEALLYPLKEDYMVKILDEKYKALGLSLDDLMGLKGKGKSEDILKKNGGVK